MGFLRSEEEVEMMIEEMKRKTKGKYITQGVTFNKESERQMELLKLALMHSTSFSGLGKELLADKFDTRIKSRVSDTPLNSNPSGDFTALPTTNNIVENNEPTSENEKPIKRDIGNFLL